MRTLAIDCATEACSAALFEGGSLVAGTFEVIGRGHAERLVPMIAELPGKGRAERIVVSLGPGSFTGVPPPARWASPGRPKCSAIRRWRWSPP